MNMTDDDISQIAAVSFGKASNPEVPSILDTVQKNLLTSDAPVHVVQKVEEVPKPESPKVDTSLNTGWLDEAFVQTSDVTLDSEFTSASADAPVKAIQSKSKPSILVTGAHHARELITIQHSLYTALKMIHGGAVHKDPYY